MGSSLSGARGRVAVITGGASGLGFAAAEHCAGLGMKVVIADVNEAAAEAAAEKLRAAGATVLAIRHDVTCDADSARLRHAVYSNPEFGEIGFLFLNAGFSVGTGVLRTPVDAWKRQLDVNLYGVLHNIQHLVPRMIAQGTECRVAATSSFAGLFNVGPLGVGAGVAYCVSKHAVTLVMETLQQELRSTPGCKVTAHSLHPAGISTPYWEKASAEGDALNATAAERGILKGMQQLAQSPALVAKRLADGIAAGKFYILSGDGSVPKEQAIESMRVRVDDIADGSAPLSHMLRGSPAGKASRERLRKAQKAGLARL
eukprot:TRINITY_DN2047_c5_g1_i1.p1 TRINITY_DN2047_c5_g1~~TRINITY_DN2047_c5_g1_i1.p1  ORF type:complete len:339 (+),score=105.02 TRINITY_DN2047_c5_g1_i1:73-1017(+)